MTGRATADSCFAMTAGVIDPTSSIARGRPGPLRASWTHALQYSVMDQSVFFSTLLAVVLAHVHLLVIC